MVISLLVLLMNAMATVTMILAMAVFVMVVMVKKVAMIAVGGPLLPQGLCSRCA